MLEVSGGQGLGVSGCGLMLEVRCQGLLFIGAQEILGSALLDSSVAFREGCQLGPFVLDCWHCWLIDV